MAIRFECTKCNNTLEVPDGSEGQQAKCPACSAVLEVPHTQSHDSERLPETHESVNPYASTSSPDSQGASSLAPLSKLSVQQVDVDWTLRATWQLFKVHCGILIGIFMIMVAAAMVSWMGFLIVRVATMAVAGQMNQATALSLTIGLGILENVISQVISLWFTIGSIRVMLQISRNQAPNLGLLLESAPFLLRTCLATLLFGILVLGGLILFIIPGIYVCLTYWNYNYFIVDRNCGVWEAFRLAKVHASGNRLSIFVIGLIFLVLGLLGFLACGVGWIATSPFCMLMLVITYLTMTGQPFAQPRIATNEPE